METKHKFALILTLTLILVGQLVFALASPFYLSPQYTNRIFATTGIQSIAVTYTS